MRTIIGYLIILLLLKLLGFTTLLNIALWAPIIVLITLAVLMIIGMKGD